MESDQHHMSLAIDAAARVRCITSPNPWVGCVIVSQAGEIYTGATYESTREHAEVHALKKAGDHARGATAFVTLEPCSHHGRTPPCADALISAGIKRVVVGIFDPDERVSGQGIAQLKDAGIEVDVGVCTDEIEEQLIAYTTHRKTGRPYVILKMAMTLDGFIADKKNTHQWITGEAARADTHRMRAESDAILVGAGTVRADNPSLTVRDYTPPLVDQSDDINPVRIVLGHVDAKAKVQPCREMSGDLGEILDTLGYEGIVQLMVEGGASIAHTFHEAGLIDRYIFYVAPAIFGGNGALHVFGNDSVPTIENIWRGKFVSVEQLGSDIRIDCVRENNDHS